MKDSRKFGGTGVYFTLEEMVTQDHLDVCEALEISASPDTFFVPVVRSYFKETEFTISKANLMRRFLSNGFPYSGTVLRTSGTTGKITTGRGIFRGIFSSVVSSDVNPIGNSQIILSEIEDLGKAMEIPVDHIKFLGEDTPAIDPLMVIMDSWTQIVNGHEIFFISAYAHIDGMPGDWYSKIHLYSHDDKFHLFPEVINGHKTIRLDKRRHPLRSPVFCVPNSQFLKGLAEGLFATDPVWTLSEDVFELMAPIWWSRFQTVIREVFTSIDNSKSYTKASMHQVCIDADNPARSSVIAAYWSINRSKNGIFYGYCFDYETDTLIYGLYQSRMDEDRHVAKCLQVIDRRSIPLEDEGPSGIVFRPGFKTQPKVKPVATSCNPAVETKLDIAGALRKKEEAAAAMSTTPAATTAEDTAEASSDDGIDVPSDATESMSD